MLIEEILVNGITGFNMPKGVAIHGLPDIEFALKQLSYPFVRSGEIYAPHTSANYFKTSFTNKLSNSSFDLLTHQHLWYFTCVEANAQWGKLNFIEPEKNLIQQVEGINNNYTFLTGKLLNTKVEQGKLTALNKHELNEIKYWEPATYGQIIFNGFD